MTLHPSHTLAEMEAMLRHSQRRIFRAEVVAALRSGLRTTLTGLLALAAIFFSLRLFASFFGTPAFSGVQFFGVAAILAVGICGAALWRALRADHVGVPLAAERIDLSQATHNRIATAIALLRAGDDSPFAKTAIEDGFTCLERLQREEPHFEKFSPAWRRHATMLGAALAMVLIGIFLKPLPPALSNVDPATASLTSHLPKDLAPAVIDPVVPPVLKPATQRDVRPTSAPPAKQDVAAAGPRGTRPEPGRESRSDGPLGQHASGDSRSGSSASDSRSPASGAGAKSDPGVAPNKPTTPRAPAPQIASQPKVEQDNKKGGSINAQGSSGTGSMKTAQNEWSSEVTAKSNDGDDNTQEEEPDEVIDPDKQRLGVQPSLKNRTSGTGRELSLSMGSGVSNNKVSGRSGPSAEKKSRGTATMIMGVPVPGFVKGRLLPGPSKSTQEEVEPTPRLADLAPATVLPASRPRETTQERYRPSSDLGGRARDYLLNYHANDRNQSTTDESNE